MGNIPHNNMSNRKRKDELKAKRNGNHKRDALTGKLVADKEVVIVENAPEYLRTLGYRVIPPAIDRLVLVTSSIFIFIWTAITIIH